MSLFDKDTFSNIDIPISTKMLMSMGWDADAESLETSHIISKDFPCHTATGEQATFTFVIKYGWRNKDFFGRDMYSGEPTVPRKHHWYICYAKDTQKELYYCTLEPSEVKTYKDVIRTIKRHFTRSKLILDGTI